MVKRKKPKGINDIEENKTNCLETSTQAEALPSQVEDSRPLSPVCPSIESTEKPSMPTSIRCSSRVTAIKALKKLSGDKNSNLAVQLSETIHNTCENELLNNLDKAGQRSRIYEKNKKNLSPDQSKKQNWAKHLWSIDDKNNFFDALGEYGKDFENIQIYLASRAKRKGIPSLTIKNKDQVRHFYYRTWNKISKYLEMGDGINKQTQELYGLLNYAELRKKIGGSLNEKNIQKLNELIQTGSTIVKIKGKRWRIKTPICPALKKINNVESSEHGDVRLPKEIYVEFRPANNKSWLHVQNISQNPRVRSKVSLQRRFKTLMEYLQKRWEAPCLKKKENLKINLMTLSNTDDTKDITKVLRVFPLKDCPISLVKIDSLNMPLTSNIDLSLENYKKHCHKEQKTKEAPPKSKHVSPKMVEKSLLHCEKKKKAIEHNLKDGHPLGVEKNKETDNEEPRIESTAAKESLLDDKCPEPLSNPEDEANRSLFLLQSMLRYDSLDDEEECQAEEAQVPSLKEKEKTKPDVYPLKHIGSPQTSGIEEIYLSTQRGSENLTLGQILGMAENNNDLEILNNESDNQGKGSSMPEGKKDSSQDAVQNAEKDKQMELEISKIRKGWTLEDVGLLTVGQLYLMLGSPDKIELEYDWENRKDENEQPTSEEPPANATLMVISPSMQNDPEDNIDEILARIINPSQDITKNDEKEEKRGEHKNNVKNLMHTLLRYSNDLMEDIKVKSTSVNSIQAKLNSPSTGRIPGARIGSRLAPKGIINSLQAKSQSENNHDAEDVPSTIQDTPTFEKDANGFAIPMATTKLVKHSFETCGTLEEVRQEIDKMLPSRRNRIRSKKSLVMQRSLLSRGRMRSLSSQATYIHPMPTLPTNQIIIENNQPISAASYTIGNVTLGPSLSMPIIDAGSQTSSVIIAGDHYQVPLEQNSLAGSMITISSQPSSMPSYTTATHFVSTSANSPPLLSIPESLILSSSDHFISLAPTIPTDTVSLEHSGQVLRFPTENLENPQPQNVTSVLDSFPFEAAPLQIDSRGKSVLNFETDLSLGPFNTENFPLNPPPAPQANNKTSSSSTSSWINNELGDISLGSLFDTPIKDSSNSGSMGSEVNRTLHCLLTETSNDYVSKFADLANHVVESSSNL